MLLLCATCSRQLDVPDAQAGHRVRCPCGQTLVAPAQPAREAAILHCASCGGPLTGDAAGCAYCGGSVDRDAPRHTLVCPRCFARLPGLARFCTSCALPLRPQALGEAGQAGARCPRCRRDLQGRVLDSITFDECPGCAGLFLSNAAFKSLTDRQVEAHRQNPLPEPTRGVVPAGPVEYLPCPVCETRMNRSNYGRSSGVIIDTCKEHGIWLDADELDRIVAFIVSGGLAAARTREAEETERRAREAMSRQRAVRAEGYAAEPQTSTWIDVLTRWL
jgi:Zn-finger nucleic acid-binding protein